MSGLACAGHDLTNVNLRLLAKMIAFAPHHRALGSGKKTVDYMSRGFPENSEETVGLCSSQLWKEEQKTAMAQWQLWYLDIYPHGCQTSFLHT